MEGVRMTRKANITAGAPRSKDAPEGLLPEPGDVDEAPDRIVARPDGYHWLAQDGKQEFGPFETVELAQQDMDAADGGELDPTLSLQEAVREIGIGEWLDPETGEPAEGPSPPHPEGE
ncbi:MAG: hypothetical protein Q7K57_27815 [Burkholderiaceae bacterium]|nr:hypothetical protein [Burkholderiaceae bacterium]